MSAKNVVYPEYNTEMIDKFTKFIVSLIHSLLGVRNREPVAGTQGPAEAPLAITIVINYIILAGMALLIVANVQSFLKKLLVTLKNIMRDNEI